MHTFFLLLWGTCTLASIIGAITIIVLHDRHLRQDMKLRDEGIYITRVPRREALIGLLTPIFPAGFFALYLYTQVELGILINLLAFIMLLFFPYHFSARSPGVHENHARRCGAEALTVRRRDLLPD